ncbi:MAG TPA: DnaJ domain-containing protein [Gammaproteobacteria bacterium]|nr:DnaJ domain-containing protein [Gammaproteobacteria bacterium]
MIWPATITCGLVGMAVAHIPGALLGLLIGSVIDRNLAINSWADLHARLSLSIKPALNAEQVLFMLLGHLAKSTGRVTSEHIQSARTEMQRMQLNDTAQKAAIAAFTQGKECALADLRNGLRVHYGASQAERVLTAGWRMACAQGLATAKQRRILKQCADWLGCPAETFARLEAQSMRGSLRPRPPLKELDAALQLLGVKRSASLAQVKQAYRRQVSIHHPDKLIGAGAPPAQLRAATEKTRALHQAYAVVRKHLQV